MIFSGSQIKFTIYGGTVRIGEDDTEDFIDYLSATKLRLRVLGTMNEVSEKTNSSMVNESIGLMLHGYVDQSKGTRIGIGEMGTGEFISYETLPAMARMENTRFILMEDGEATY